MSAPETALEAILHEASTLADQGRWEEVHAILREQLGDHPADPTLLCMIGVAAGELGADDAAREYFRRCLAEAPSDPLLLVTAGSGLAPFSEPEAEAALRLAALTAPHLPAARLQYGSLLAREGQLDLALVELLAARDLDADDVQIRLELGVLRGLRGEWMEAVEELAEAAAHDEGDAEPTSLLGLVQLEAGESGEAAESLHRAAVRRVDDWELQLACALACAVEGWEDEAWNAHARAAGIDEADPDVLLEVEDAISLGPEAAEPLLREELAPSLLRRRLRERA
jgi:tetratricopeptide (TPR) repeat protein